MLKHLLETRPYLIVPFKIGCQHHDTIELTQNAPSIEIAVKVVRRRVVFDEWIDCKATFARNM